jgi:hypothetical protein
VAKLDKVRSFTVCWRTWEFVEYHSQELQFHLEEYVMALLDKLERKFRRYAVPNVTLYLILGQVLFFVFVLSGRFILERVVLIPDRVLAGEWWRLITFLFVPPMTNPIFAFFAWYLFYLMGNALEGHWGRSGTMCTCSSDIS